MTEVRDRQAHALGERANSLRNALRRSECCCASFVQPARPRRQPRRANRDRARGRSSAMSPSRRRCRSVRRAVQLLLELVQHLPLSHSKCVEQIGSGRDGATDRPSRGQIGDSTLQAVRGALERVAAAAASRRLRLADAISRERGQAVQARRPSTAARLRRSGAPGRRGRCPRGLLVVGPPSASGCRARSHVAMHGQVDEIAQAQLALTQGAAPQRDALDEHGHAAEASLDAKPRRLDPLGERDLVLARERLRAAHLTEVGIDQVARETRLAVRSTRLAPRGLSGVGSRSDASVSEAFGWGRAGRSGRRELESGGRALLPEPARQFPNPSNHIAFARAPKSAAECGGTNAGGLKRDVPALWAQSVVSAGGKTGEISASPCRPAPRTPALAPVRQMGLGCGKIQAFPSARSRAGGGGMRRGLRYNFLLNSISGADGAVWRGPQIAAKVGAAALIGAAVSPRNGAAQNAPAPTQGLRSTPRSNCRRSHHAHDGGAARPFPPMGFRRAGRSASAKTVIHNYGHGGCGVTAVMGHRRHGDEVGAGDAASAGCGDRLRRGRSRHRACCPGPWLRGRHLRQGASARHDVQMSPPPCSASPRLVDERASHRRGGRPHPAGRAVRRTAITRTSSATATACAGSGSS